MKMEKTLGDYLRKKKWTLAVAESCTGGWICDRLTDVPGSSDYFMGGMVTYSNQSKTDFLGVPAADIKRYGAVSPQVAKKMAQGVRKAFGTTFGLSTTGIAGPTGGSPEKPVGLVYIAISDAKHTTVIKEIFKGNRREIKQATTGRSLKYFYHFIIKRDRCRLLHQCP